MKNNYFFIFTRYLILILIDLGNLFIFYTVFTPLTFYLVKLFLSFFGQTVQLGNIILFGSIAIELIPACIAGAAYYLLLVIILSTPMKLKTYPKIILFSFGTFLIINSLRISFLVLISRTAYFEPLHQVFWYVLSTVFVVFIWIAGTKIFKIKEIPVYSDIKSFKLKK